MGVTKVVQGKGLLMSFHGEIIFHSQLISRINLLSGAGKPFPLSPICILFFSFYYELFQIYVEMYRG